jgi:hypothetical protein
MKEFTKKIESILKEFDDKEIDSVIASIPARRQSRRNSIDKQVRGGFNYPEVWASCGGKCWYKLLEWCDADLTEILTKDNSEKNRPCAFVCIKNIDNKIIFIMLILQLIK